MKQEKMFLDYLEQWFTEQQSLSWNDIQGELVVGVVDMVKGFCEQGPLASPRIADLIPTIKNYLLKSEDRGCSEVFYPCDAHQDGSLEFESFPPHCVENTEESQLVSDLEECFVQGRDRRVDKRSLSSFVGTDLSAVLRERYGDKETTFLILGDCTDLCVFHCVFGLIMLKNTYDLPWQIIVPEDGVNTYDLTIEVAKDIGAMAHPGDLWHKLGLYQMALNGAKIVKTII